VTSIGSKSWFLAGVVALGCTTLAGLDDEYVAEGAAPQAGTSGTGGSGPDEDSAVVDPGGNGGALGAFGTGGEGGAGGTLGAGGTGGEETDASGDAGCAEGQKFCSALPPATGGECTLPRPLVGCSLSDCSPCNAPPHNANVICKNDACDFECEQGYLRSGDQCIPMGSGGTAGAAGTAGTAGAAGSGGSGGAKCDPAQCAACGPAGPFRCCLRSTCGCTWAPGAYCFPS
jgi:hypothetical protein